ncbi:MAG: hypothetical protein AAFQ94_24930 [Bacteroidota bacterium]
MPTDTLAPKLKFHNNHRPAMDDGEYVIEIRGEITRKDKITTDNTINGRDGDGNPIPVTTRFAVYGERFSLTDQDIRSVFPATASTGEYAAVIPHVILKRSTLPWERHANEQDEDMPWLLLLLFDEDEVPEKKILTVSQLRSSDSTTVNYPDLPEESAQHSDDKLTVIDVSKELMTAVAPSAASLKFMAHTRQGVDENDQLIGEEHAVVIGNRLPQQGKRSTMHLVSVESRYDGNGFLLADNELPYRLVSLKNWEFYAIEHFKITSNTLVQLATHASAQEIAQLSVLLDREYSGTETEFLAQVAAELSLDDVPNSYKAVLAEKAKFDKTFNGILMNLNKDLLTLRLPRHSNADAEKNLSQGLVPIRHYFRNGDESVSWYKGPFMPNQPDSHTRVRELKPESADELLLFNDPLGMFDVTYSAAWEIGRLTALSSKDFSVNLYRWKRLIAQGALQLAQQTGNEHLARFPHSSNHESAEAIWRDHLKPWLLKLIAFELVPPNYLVPDEQVLPAESIRFFHVDKNWLTSALLGAFSMGGIWEARQQEMDNDFNTFLSLTDSYKVGFALRSDVVDGWPGIIIEGVSVSNNEKLIPARYRLSRNTELCFFKDEISQVTFHQKPEVIHFGLLKDNAVYEKTIRNDDGSQGVNYTLVADDWKTLTKRVINMHELANNLGEGSNPAKFAMNMIEGIPRVVFDINQN